MKPSRPRASGFSLLEMMVVATLVSILALLVTPTMADWRRNQRIRGAAENLLQGLQLAREEAIRRNRPVSFWLVSDLTGSCTLSDTSGIWIISINTPWNNCNAAPSMTEAPLLIKAGEVPGALNVKAVAQGVGQASEARFDGYGRIPEGTGRILHIDVTDPDDAGKPDATTHAYRSLRVAIRGSGAVRMCDPRITTPGDTRAC